MLLIISVLTGKNAGNESFFIGEKKSRWYLVAFGMIGASLSGVTFISIPGVVGNFNSPNGQFSYMQLALGYVAGYAVIATVLMPLYYRLNLTSIYTYLEQRFGFWSYKTGAAFFILSRTIGSTLRLFLVAIVLQKFVFDYWGIPFELTVLMTLVLIWVYTFKGGIKTIVWTDTFQTLFLLASVLITIYIISDEMNAGLSGLIHTIRESAYSQLFFWEPKENSFFFKQFFSGMFTAIVMTGLDQDMMQKNNSCKNIGEAQKNMFSFSIVLVFVNLLFVSLGALLYIYIETNGIARPERTDYLFPMLAIDYFPAIAGVIFLLGLTAAAYSSADSALTALTTSFCVDFLNFEKRKDAPQEQLIKTRYAVHIGFTALSFALIILFKYVLKEDVISNVLTLAGYTYGPLLGLFSFGLFTKRRIHDRLAPLVCIASPVIYYFLNQNSETLFWGYKFGFEGLMLNGLLTFTGLWLISLKIEANE